MLTKKFLVSAMIAAGTLAAVATPLPSVAATSFYAELNAPPPAYRYEPVPVARRGYLWSPGYWGWNGYRHVWVAGHWERARPGYVYRAPGWVEYNGRWHHQPSRWDRDGDGIPNMQDRTPDGRGPRWDRDNDGVPNRYDRTPNGMARDRDGDGVPNRYDYYPNNPNWR
jgi:YXWGXW repeat-containing protein/thrombospondin type 3 repeat protein